VANVDHHDLWLDKQISEIIFKGIPHCVLWLRMVIESFSTLTVNLTIKTLCQALFIPFPSPPSGNDKTHENWTYI
jgi:hypothetical protein